MPCVNNMSVSNFKKNLGFQLNIPHKQCWLGAVMPRKLDARSYFGENSGRRFSHRPKDEKHIHRVPLIKRFLSSSFMPWKRVPQLLVITMTLPPRAHPTTRHSIKAEWNLKPSSASSGHAEYLSYFARLCRYDSYEALSKSIVAV